MDETSPLERLRSVDEDVWPILDQLARALRLQDAGLQATLDAIVAKAVHTIDPAEHSGLILLIRGALVPQATVGEPAARLDVWQRDHDEGPCIDAARRQQIIRIADTASEDRWPAFASAAAPLGVASMLCVPLWVANERLGTLSLYAERPQAFTDHELHLTELYATHAALALADANRSQHLRTALASRDLIGQAKGILMERDRLTSDAAFDVLVVASQATNRKLVAVAQHLVETGELVVARAR